MLTSGKTLLYLSFAALFWRLALFNSLFFFTGMWVLFWRNEDITIYRQLFTSLIFGVSQGLTFAWIKRSLAKKSGLSKWEDLA
jgi:hypothetical protein